MIARAWLAAHGAIDAGALQLFRQGRTEQEVIEPEAGVARPAISHIVPVRVNRRVRMERTDRIGPALLEQVGVGRAAFGLHQRVIVP